MFDVSEKRYNTKVCADNAFYCVCFTVDPLLRSYTVILTHKHCSLIVDNFYSQEQVGFTKILHVTVILTSLLEDTDVFFPKTAILT
jgi:hypothetical protein